MTEHLGRLLLILADGFAVIAMAAILQRLFFDWQRDQLTAKDFLVGGFLFLAILGLFVAGVQTLMQSGRPL